MLKPLTMSLSLALAMSFSGVSFAGHHGALPSAQEPMVSPQSVIASPQCYPAEKHCFKMPSLNLCDKLSGLGCGLKDAGHKLSCGVGDLCKKLKPKPACYTYEWVLKKKKVHGGCGNAGCDTCGGPAPAVYPTSQVAPAPQGPVISPAPQAYGSGQVVGATASIGGVTPAPVAGDEAPPAPEVGPQSSLLFSTPRGN